MKSSVPKYKQIQHYITMRIDNGKWPVGAQIPTDAALAGKFKVARMTVIRAMQELADRGHVQRIQGGGTFVADVQSQSALLELADIAVDIENRGHHYSCAVHHLAGEPASAVVAKSLELEIGTPVWRSTTVHHENGWPVQLEIKFVDPDFAPDYLQQDFTKITPRNYLMRCGPLDQIEHIVEAVIPDDRAQDLLKISDKEPCLLLHRRTWSGKQVVSRSWLYHPGSRYRLGAVFSEMPANRQADNIRRLPV